MSRRKIANSIRCCALATALFLGLGVIGNGSNAAETVRIGLLPFLSFAPHFIALEKGYFRDQGLDVETTMIRGGGTAAFNATLAGQIDISSGAITASLLNAVIKGVKISVIADKGQLRTGHSTNELWITKALHDSGVRSVKGMKGKTVATASPGTSDWLILGLLAENAGLSLPGKDIKAVSLRAPERWKALESGTVDGAILIEPFISRVDRSKVVRLARVSDIHPSFQVAVVYTTGKYLTEHGDVVEKFLSAVRKAAKEYMANPTSDEIVSILSKYTKVPPAFIKKATTVYFSPDAKVDTDAIKRQMKYMLKHKMISRAVAIDEFVDSRAR